MWSVVVVDAQGYLVEVLCQGEKWLRGATSFAAGYGQSAKGAVVVMMDSFVALDELVSINAIADLLKARDAAAADAGSSDAAGRVTRAIGEEIDEPIAATSSDELPECTESARPVTHDESTIETILECINDLSSDYVASLFDLCQGMELVAASEWHVYAFEDHGISRVNDSPMNRDSAEHFRSLLDPELFASAMLWPASVAMPKALQGLLRTSARYWIQTRALKVPCRSENGRKTTKTALPTIGASEGKQVCCTS